MPKAVSGMSQRGDCFSPKSGLHNDDLCDPELTLRKKGACLLDQTPFYRFQKPQEYQTYQEDLKWSYGLIGSYRD